MRKGIYFFISMFLCFSIAVPVAATTVNDLKKQRESLSNKKNEAKKNLNSTTTEKKNAQYEADQLDQELMIETDELDIITTTLANTNKLLTQNEKDLAAATEEREVKYEVFKKRSRYLYMNGSTGYLEIVLNARNFSDLANKAEYMNRVVEYDKTLVDQLKNVEAIITEKVDEIAQQRSEVQVLLTQKKEKTDALAIKLAKKERQIIALSNDEKEYANQIKSLENSDKEIEALIKKKEEDNRRAAAAAAAKSSSGASSSVSRTVSAPYTGGKFRWPAAAGSSISSGYGSRTSPINGKGEFHTGIDIPASNGTDIYAAGDGTVISSGWRGGYGNTIVIDHGGGVTTLYGHSSKLVSSTNQEVKSGQVVAKIGSTGYSTGPHVHFEVRVSGTHTNPMNYLK